MDSDAPLQQHSDDDGATPLYIAAQDGHGEVVEALLKGGCDVDKATNDGATPLLIAAQEGQREVVEALLKGWCHVDKADDHDDTPLFMAAAKGHGEVVEAFLKGGCDVDKATNDGATPLIRAKARIRTPHLCVQVPPPPALPAPSYAARAGPSLSTPFVSLYEKDLPSGGHVSCKRQYLTTLRLGYSRRRWPECVNLGACRR